jgi:hypothetical protein
VDQIRLPDLEVIRRYSIAVRREHAPAEEVLEALQADVDAIRRALRGSGPEPRSAPRPAPRSAPRARAAAKPSRSKTRSRRRG